MKNYIIIILSVALRVDCNFKVILQTNESVTSIIPYEYDDLDKEFDTIPVQNLVKFQYNTYKEQNGNGKYSFSLKNDITDRSENCKILNINSTNPLIILEGKFKMAIGNGYIGIEYKATENGFFFNPFYSVWLPAEPSKIATYKNGEKFNYKKSSHNFLFALDSDEDSTFDDASDEEYEEEEYDTEEEDDAKQEDRKNVNNGHEDANDFGSDKTIPQLSDFKSNEQSIKDFIENIVQTNLSIVHRGFKVNNEKENGLHTNEDEEDDQDIYEDEEDDNEEDDFDNNENDDDDEKSDYDEKEKDDAYEADVTEDMTTEENSNLPTEQSVLSVEYKTDNIVQTNTSSKQNEFNNKENFENENLKAAANFEYTDYAEEDGNAKYSYSLTNGIIKRIEIGNILNINSTNPILKINGKLEIRMGRWVIGLFYNANENGFSYRDYNHVHIDKYW